MADTWGGSWEESWGTSWSPTPSSDEGSWGGSWGCSWGRSWGRLLCPIPNKNVSGGSPQGLPGWRDPFVERIRQEDQDMLFLMPVVMRALDDAL